MATLRYIGWCPVCERDIKVRGGRLVHHGYERPGVGYIVGDCPGVGFPPYELSTEAATEYLDHHVTFQINGLVRDLKTLNSPEGPPWLLFKDYDIDRRRVILDPNTRQPRMVRLSKVAADALEDQLLSYDRGRYSWERRIGELIGQTESKLKFWGHERQRIEKLIAEWVPRTLRTVEEETQRREGARSRREEKRAQAIAEKIDREVVKIQKRIDAALRTKNSAVLADIFGGNKLREISNWKLSREDAIATLDRDYVWDAFGLTVSGGYVPKEEARPILDAMTFGDHRYGRANWPDVLGGGRAKTRG